MAATVQNGSEGVTIESVEHLYEQFERMNIPSYYAEGGVNPFAGRTSVVPRKATFYALVPEKDEAKVVHARRLLKGVANRRKVREAVREKHEINYNQFAPASRIVILWV